jgi:hypothetical protein
MNFGTSILHLLRRRVRCRDESICFASSRDNSKPSIASLHFRLFTLTWGICFSLEG